MVVLRHADDAVRDVQIADALERLAQGDPELRAFPVRAFFSATGIAWFSSSQASQVYEPNAETEPAP